MTGFTARMFLLPAPVCEASLIILIISETGVKLDEGIVFYIF
jgi:hypothetical protein